MSHRTPSAPVTPILLLAAALGVSATAEPEKKLIQLGWDGGTPAKMLANLEQMKSGPFDGHVFKLPDVPDGSDRPLPLQNMFTVEPQPEPRCSSRTSPT